MVSEITDAYAVYNGDCCEFTPTLPDGSVHFVELKAPGGRPSPLQKLFAARMKELRQNYTILWSKTEIDEWRASLLPANTQV